MVARLASISWRWLAKLVPGLNGCVALTTAAVPWYIWLYRPLNELFIVSVSTNVPAMNATPSSTASAVSA